MPMLLGFKLNVLNISSGPETHSIFMLSDRFFPFQKATRHFYFYFFKRFIFLFYLCVQMCLCESIWHMFEGTHGGEKMSDLLKLDLQAIVSCLT